MEKIGITGASGFIGNNVTKYLADKGYKIIAFGRESDRNFKHDNVEWKILDLNFIKKDDLEGIEKLFHFAGAYTAQDAFSKNVSMLKKVLEVAHEAEIKEFYFISTYAVFGDRKNPASPTSPHAPLEAYAMSKVIGEEEFNKWKALGKIRGSIIRPCSLYGNYGKNFIDIIKDKIKKKEEIQMVRFKNQFLHVDDFSEELMNIINFTNHEPSYNIEGEIITEIVLKDIFEEINVPYSLSEHQTRSYWCEGNKPMRKNNVKDYLKEFKKSLQPNSNFEFESTDIPGVILIKPRIFGDERGFFLEVYKKEDFENSGIRGYFVQDNHSKSKKGVIRGIHLQKGEKSQAKIVRCLKGALWDVAVDLRKGSKTFGKHFGAELSEENRYMLYVPRGCGHGFAALTEGVEMEYKNDNLYSPGDEIGVIWNDPYLNIPWPIENPIISEKDQKLPNLEKFKEEL